MNTLVLHFRDPLISEYCTSQLAEGVDAVLQIGKTCWEMVTYEGVKIGIGDQGMSEEIAREWLGKAEGEKSVIVNVKVLIEQKEDG